VLLKLNSKNGVLFNVNVSSWLMLSGLVIFTRTVSTPTLSVTFACKVIVLVTLKIEPLVGILMTTLGDMTSSPTKNVLSVKFMLFTLSFAKKSTV